MRILIIIFLLSPFLGKSQNSDTNFFPRYIPYSQNPIIKYGDEIPGTPWNDPVVLKENGQYLMYTSGVQGGINHPNDTIGIYRWISNDGYAWSLNPITPVLDAIPGSYYQGGVETPSIVFYKGQYHLYTSVYAQNSPFAFKIAHATSSDGINWQMDTIVALEPTLRLNWMNAIVAEPGVLVKQDTLYLFFSAVSLTGGQNIGLVRSIDGVQFIDTTLTARLPKSVYPSSNNYLGLSTPSPLLVGDTIYLFTDVIQNVFGNNWTQVALHQFKSYNDINKWYSDAIPIHTRADFPWTNGNYQAEIRSICALLDSNRIRIWYAGHNISSIDTNKTPPDTSNNVYFIGNELHVDSNFWAIGTSEYTIDTTTSLKKHKVNQFNISIFPNPAKEYIRIKTDQKYDLLNVSIYNLTGQLLKQIINKESIEVLDLHQGTYIVRIEIDNSFLYRKFIKAY